MTTQPTSDAPPTTPSARRRWRRWLLGGAAALVAYALLGALLAPRLLRSALEEKGTAALHRKVTVKEVRVNPFTLAVTVLGLEVADLGAPRLAGWDSLYVRLAPWKALRGDLGVAEIHLTRPFGRLALDPSGRLNVQDLLVSEPAAAATAPPPAGPSTLGVALDRLEIEEASLVFADATRAPAFETKVGPLTVRLSDFRTRGGADSPYAFTGRTEAGETFSWSGTVLSEPLRSSGTIAFGGVTLPKYDPYLKEQAPSLAIGSGKVDLRAGYRLEWGTGARRVSLSGLEVVLQDLSLARRRDATVALRLPRLEVLGGEVDVLGQVATIAEVKVLGLQLQPRREPDGKVTLLEMLERPARPQATATATSSSTASNTAAHPERSAEGAKSRGTPTSPSTAGNTAAHPERSAEGAKSRGTSTSPSTASNTAAHPERSAEGAKSRGTPPAAPAWTWAVTAVSIEKASVLAEDLVPARPVRLSLPSLDARLTGLTGKPDVACPLDLSLRWGEKGQAAAKGTVWPFQARADLKVDAAGLDLSPLGPYLDGAAPVRLAEALLGLAARVTFDGQGRTPSWTFVGDVHLDGLSLRHPVRNEELVRWRSLELLGVDAASAGSRASVRTVRFTEPSLRAIVFEDGSTSAGAQAPAPAAASTPGAVATVAPASAPQAPAGQPWRTAIGLFQVVRGRVAFVDRSIKPPVLVSLTGIEARVANLSSDPRVRSTVDVRAKVDGSAPVTVTGTLNPLQAGAYADLAISVKGVDLTPLDPYAGKHLGYGLQKGKLDLDVTYRVQDRALQAANVTRLDQLTLGEATGSPDATAIPVRFALALLKDSDGVILLDVPVEGRLDDPEFRFGKVIWRTVLNVLVKVATSPFSALAALAGGGKEDISLVEFPPGGSALDEPAARRIDLLAKSLAKRPGLALDLEGTADPVADLLALRRAGLERRLREAKAAALRPPVPADGVTVAAEERPRLLEQAFRAAFPPPAVPAPKPPPGTPPEPPPTPAAMEERLLAAEPVPAEALVALAAARTAAAREALLAAGVEGARVFTVEGGKRAAQEPGARAYFTVK